MAIFGYRHFVFLIYVVLFFVSSNHNFCVKGQDGSIFDVRKFGAKGDRKTDDSKAFTQAWQAACKASGSTVLVPSGLVFFIRPVIFSGTGCRNITMQVEGQIIAPQVSDYETSVFQWILFDKVQNGFTIKGNGVLDAQGQSWWKTAAPSPDAAPEFDSNHNTILPNEGFSDYAPEASGLFRPHAIRIANGNNIFVTNIKIQNSPRMHVFFDGCRNVQVNGLKISSPGDSPNTDGIHLSNTVGVDIRDSTLACGDDCVSIQAGCSSINIFNVDCGPGHGFSIGGLGKNGASAVVFNVSVTGSNVRDAKNGVRIKTWKGSRGSVRDVTFSNIRITNVENPIAINQFYCDGLEFCKNNKTSASSDIAISDITYLNITGTYAFIPVTFQCSDSVPCRNLTLGTIQFTPTGPKAKENKPVCSAAFGKTITSTVPDLKDCLSGHRSPPTSAAFGLLP